MKNFIKKWQGLSIGGLVFSLYLFVQVVALAQSVPGQIKNLEVEIWPEFDRPDTLVIYHAELAPATPLPAQVTFRLPGYLEKMHVVAVEQPGGLAEVSADSIELKHEGDDLLLTFAASASRIQFEYYDPVILSKEGQERQLNFAFVASYPIEKAVFQVQEPFQAENFKLTPAPTSSFTGSDGLKYNTLEIAGLAVDDPFTLTANYSRSSDEVSAQNLAGLKAEHAADLTETAEPLPNQNLTLGYTLIGIGGVLLLSVGGYWWWSTRMRPAKAASLPRRPQKGAKPAKISVSAQTISATGIFCYRCGATLREEAHFCHVCGAERRTT